MFNLITLSTTENKTTVSGVRMVGESVKLTESDIKINEYRADLVGCEVIDGNVISDSGEVLYSLNGVQGEQV
ncbi:hypothetical protein [Pseudoalteromonas sp. JB197]|uniref:hypothetical protein n=1 Tax=Pseudoalteromonas sp. JB197 TaxID=1434839 RepID=UPI00097F36A3|nr:hypothetical protein [Pseudoalteromonas sp. JB197]PCC12898.1 hypothetical protein CIK86_06185 [Pseudoalteromonas sp. JB197]SJN25562.1 hypothetical protein CZ797_04300 [Pseudoalteromonas sp. JB197]